MGQIDSVSVSHLATEWSFRFANASVGAEDGESCDLEILFPRRFESPPATSRLTGSFSALIEPTGDLYLKGFDAELSSFALPLMESSGVCHPYPTGRLELCLDPHPCDSRMDARLPAANKGFVDLRTGFTQLTWGVYAHSPDLHRVHFEPIPVLVSESGILDLDTMSWCCAGIGLVVGGQINGTWIRIANRMQPSAVVALELPSRIPPDGKTPLNITYRDTVRLGAPQPDRVAIFELSGSVLGPSGGLMGLDPSIVEIRAGGECQVTLITQDIAPDARVQVYARGAGHCRVASAVVAR